MSNQPQRSIEGMRREQFTLDAVNIDWVEEDGEPSLPTLSVVFEGDETTLHERLRGRNGEEISSDETDVTVRLHGTPDEADASGVVAVTNRVTGEYLIEVNVDADVLLSFVTAARRYGERTDDTARYRVRIAANTGDAVVTHEKQTLLVYSDDGELLRGHSLIPSGVEI